MLLFHHKIFSTMLQSGELRFTSPDLYREMSEAQRFAVTLRTSSFTFGASIGVEVNLYTSFDGSEVSEVAGVLAASPTKDVIEYFSAGVELAEPLGPYTRFGVKLTDVGSGLCEVWVTGRAKDYRGRSMVSMLAGPGQDEPDLTARTAALGWLDEQAIERLARPRSPYDWSKDGMTLTAGSGITPHAERGWRPRTELGDAAAGTSTGSAPAAAFRGPMGVPGTGGSTLDDRLAEVGRLLDITRDLDALRELRDRTMFEVIDSITEGGLSAELANSPLAQRLGAGVADRLTTDLPASTTGARERIGYTGTLDPMDWRSYGESDGGARDPFGLGRLGLVGQGGTEPGPAPGLAEYKAMREAYVEWQLHLYDMMKPNASARDRDLERSGAGAWFDAWVERMGTYPEGQRPSHQSGGREAAPGAGPGGTRAPTGMTGGPDRRGDVDPEQGSTAIAAFARQYRLGAGHAAIAVTPQGFAGPRVRPASDPRANPAATRLVLPRGSLVDVETRTGPEGAPTYGELLARAWAGHGPMPPRAG